MKLQTLSITLLLMFSLSMQLKAQQKATTKPATKEVQNNSNVALADASKPKIALSGSPEKKDA